jgi:hypothetical protein
MNLKDDVYNVQPQVQEFSQCDELDFNEKHMNEGTTFEKYASPFKPFDPIFHYVEMLQERYCWVAMALALQSHSNNTSVSLTPFPPKNV